MKIILRILFFTFLSFALSQLFSQDDCKVLIPEISGQYVGKCKKGLAHGKGLAIGIDRYEGSFKKGYPEGDMKVLLKKVILKAKEPIPGRQVKCMQENGQMESEMEQVHIHLLKMISKKSKKVFGRMMCTKDLYLKNLKSLCRVA